MIEHVLNPRITENKDWVVLLFLLSLAIIAITKSNYENRFGDFSNLLFSDKYIKIYKDSNNLKSTFTISLFLVQILTLAYFLQLLLHSFNYGSKTDWTLYIQITTFLFYFILSKYLIEKIIATAFNIEEFVMQFNLQKLSYRTYITLFILPINIILFYYDTISTIIPLMIVAIILVSNIVTYFASIKNYQNLIMGKLFYFILYLCTLEIAPYFFMYYWYKKSSA